MSVIATALKHMLAAGMDAAQIVAAVAEMEAAMPAAELAPRRTKAAERTARWRANKEAEQASQSVTERHETSHSVTDVTRPFLSSPPSPRPLSTTTNLSQVPPIVPQAEGKKPARRRFPTGEHAELAKRIWTMQPVVEGKRKQTSTDVAEAVNGAVGRGGDPAEIEAACKAFYRLPASTKDGGQFAMGAARLLEKDRWRDFLPAGPSVTASAAKPFPNAEVRRVVLTAKRGDEAWARSYIDRCDWRPADMAILCPTNFVAETLRKEVPELIKRGAKIVVQAPATADLLQLTPSDRSVA